MPLIEIDTPKSTDGGPVVGWGTIIKMDGQELKEVRSIHVDIGIEEAVTVTAEVLARQEFHFVAAADLRITAVVQPGYRLIEETRPDGSRVWRTEEE